MVSDDTPRLIEAAPVAKAVLPKATSAKVNRINREIGARMALFAEPVSRERGGMSEETQISFGFCEKSIFQTPL